MVCQQQGQTIQREHNDTLTGQTIQRREQPHSRVVLLVCTSTVHTTNTKQTEYNSMNTLVTTHHVQTERYGETNDCIWVRLPPRIQHVIHIACSSGTPTGRTARAHQAKRSTSRYQSSQASKASTPSHTTTCAEA